MSFLLGLPVFRGYVKFLGCIVKMGVFPVFPQGLGWKLEVCEFPPPTVAKMCWSKPQKIAKSLQIAPYSVLVFLDTSSFAQKNQLAQTLPGTTQHVRTCPKKKGPHLPRNIGSNVLALHPPWIKKCVFVKKKWQKSPNGFLEKRLRLSRKNDS